MKKFIGKNKGVLLNLSKNEVVLDNLNQPHSLTRITDGFLSLRF